MKHRGIRFAILCLMAALLMLAPLTSASADIEGGVFGVFDGDALLAFASKVSDNLVFTWNSDSLKALAGKEVEVYDFLNQKSQMGTVESTRAVFVTIECDETLECESFVYFSNLEDGAEYEVIGWTDTSDAYQRIQVTAKRPSGSDIYGTYSGGTLMPGTPIYLEDDETSATLGYVCDEERYIDIPAYFSAAMSDSGSGETDDGQTGSGQTDSGETGDGQTGSGETDSGEMSSNQTGSGETDSGETSSSQTGGQSGSVQLSNAADYLKWIVYILAGALFITLVILANTRRSKKEVRHEQPAQPEPEVTKPLLESKSFTLPVEPQYKGSANSVTLECTGGALKGASFPITGRVVIGRDPGRCSIIYANDEKGVSSVHCAVEVVSDGAVIVTDLGSTYGTMVGSRQLTSGMNARVQAGEHIILGGSSNEFQVRTR